MKKLYNFIPTVNDVSLDLTELPDCIYLMENGRCSELKINRCKGKRCSFCKITENGDNEQIKWSERLNSLDEEKQMKISKKYYSGRMPWKKEKGAQNDV